MFVTKILRYFSFQKVGLGFKLNFILKQGDLRDKSAQTSWNLVNFFTILIVSTILFSPKILEN